MIPAETAGPYPGDGTNGPNVLTQSGVVRSDIRSSIGTAKGRDRCAAHDQTQRRRQQERMQGTRRCRGLPLALRSDGLYSMYSQGVTGENYLRGVQATDANGGVTFTSIFPAAYSGRWPHIHFEVFPSLASATNGQNKMRVSQLALPGRRLQGRVRDLRLQPERHEPRADVASRTTTCSATGSRCKRRRSPATPPRATWPLCSWRCKSERVAPKQYWILKSEPDSFSIDDLEKVGTTAWDGVRNYQARNYLRDTAQG